MKIIKLQCVNIECKNNSNIEYIVPNNKYMKFSQIPDWCSECGHMIPITLEQSTIITNKNIAGIL